MIETQTPFQPSWTSPPGDTLADLLEERGWTAASFAERMGYTPKHVNELLRGRASITAQTALRLESVLGSTAQFWLTRESQYRETLARRAAEPSLRSDRAWLKELPLRQMVEWGWVPEAADVSAKVSACLRYFGVSSVATWHATYSKPIETLGAFRAAERRAMHVGAVAAWLRRGELHASGLATRRWDKASFQGSLAQIRALTRRPRPDQFLSELTQRCGEAGVAFVLERAPTGCPVSGATRFLSPDKALLMLSCRHLRDDAFWFSFFHEAGHLLLHPKRTLFLEVPDVSGSEEQEANAFAERWLIPPERQEALGGLKTAADIQAFAEEIGISPGIVLGQLQHRRLIPYGRHARLLARYEWPEGDAG